MEKTDLAYLAGILDGEGCIEILCRKARGWKAVSLTVSICSTDQWICQFLKFTFGGGVYDHNSKNGGLNHCAWAWVVNGKQARDCLQLLLPYLHLKRPQAELGIKFQDAKTQKHCRMNPKPSSVFAVEEAQAILMKSLKTKGKDIFV